jgi:hypothetical protein
MKRLKFPIHQPSAKVKIKPKAGDLFGFWKVLHETTPVEYEIADGRYRYVRKIACFCTACNNTTAAPVLTDLLNNKSKHCGCLQAEQVKQANTIHGFRKHPLRTVHRNMLDRCYNSKNKRYKDYGGRGIKVCKEWGSLELENFVNWALANGYEQGLQIDRKNNDKDYYPKNCRFVTPTKNANNKSTNLYLRYKGVKYTFTEFHTKFNKGVKYGTALHRFRKLGYKAIDAVTKPLLR